MYSKYLRRIACVATLCAIVCVMASAVRAEEDKEHIAYTSRQNSKILFALGTNGAWQPELPEGVSTLWHCVDQNLPISGRFEIFRTSDFKPFFYRHEILGAGGVGMADRFAFWGLRVDDGNGGWLDFDTGGAVALLGAEKDGWWSDSPYTKTNDIGTSLSAGVNVAGAPLDVRLDTRLMHGAVRFHWRIINNDTKTRYVGLKLAADVNGGSMPGESNPTIYVPGRKFINSETILTGSDVPEYIDCIDNPGNPDFSVRYYLSGNGATKADVVAIDDWDITAASDAVNYYGSPENPVLMYTPPEYHPIGDIALAILWKPRPVKAGQYVDFISFIGLAEVTSKFDVPTADNPQYVPSIEAQRTLPYSSVASETKVPFRVTAFIEDQEYGMNLTDGSATIVLPEGLELAPTENGSYTKSFGTVTPGAESSVSWYVQATGNPSGLLDYNVTFNAKPVGGTVLTRTINVPATPSQTMNQYWQMISMPFNVTGYTDVYNALGIPGTYGVDYKMWKWDPKKKAYVKPTEFVPGEGYWLWVKKAGVSTSPNPDWTYRPMIGEKQYELARGWNIIGNPFVYTITIGECNFYHPDFGTVSYEQAINYGLISKTMYNYDTVSQKYRPYSDRTTELIPWKGFWIKALMPQVTMLMSTSSVIGASNGLASVADQESPNSGNGEDQNNGGTKKGAKDTLRSLKSWGLLRNW